MSLRQMFLQGTRWYWWSGDNAISAEKEGEENIGGVQCASGDRCRKGNVQFDLDQNAPVAALYD
jgi:hypothetical protein